MATVTIFQQTSIFDPIFFDLSGFTITESTSTRVVLDYGGGFRTEFSGSGFTFGDDQSITGGSVTQIEVFWDGELAIRYETGPEDAATISDFYEVNDGAGLIEFLLRGDDVILGSPFDDVLGGFDGDNEMSGRGGDDVLLGFDGEDMLDGGPGEDLLDGFPGPDLLEGGLGADFLYGNAGDDTLRGEEGNDILAGGTGDDRLIGGTGSDIYFVDSVDDLVTEGKGAGIDTVNSIVTHTLRANVERLFLNGFAAIDGTGNALDNTIRGNAPDNTLRGGGGDDILKGGDGNDTLKGGKGDDVLKGGAGDDTLSGNGGADKLRGGAGDDTYRAVKLVDTVKEGIDKGTDTIETRENYSLDELPNVENLTLKGEGNVSGTGNERDNVLSGNKGDNALFGGSGDDVLAGGLGNDDLAGGDGNDTFRFDAALDAATNVDVIQDFVTGTDTIVLDGLIFTALEPGELAAGAFVSGAGVVAADADDRILYDTSTGELFYDADGSGAGAAVLFAQLSGAVALAASDFLVEG
ncbi:MAG: calcium-binding protein [Gammaproteobacteria bacterium]|nr:calcium-binding protein [Gammaproteobacteria bacterium]